MSVNTRLHVLPMRSNMKEAVSHQFGLSELGMLRPPVKKLIQEVIVFLFPYAVCANATSLAMVAAPG